LLDPKDLTFTKFLGEGTSASVYVGELKGRGTVAIKVLRERIEEKLWQDFKKELKVMRYTLISRLGLYGNRCSLILSNFSTQLGEGASHRGILRRLHATTILHRARVL
jgi:hypothetical protein